MQSAKHIVFVAGEESGDHHAASIIRQLKANHSNLLISGIGGRHMLEAGVPLVSDLARHGVTGLTEVIRHIGAIKKAFKAIKSHLSQTKPDLLVLVDYPGFNLRLAKYAKRQLGIRILYYISPQIWAWKAGRINALRQYVDRMAVIYPFEKRLYEQANVPVTYVGNPLVDTINRYAHRDDLQDTFNLPANKRLLAMLPGSRTHEIEKHMPVFVQCAMMLQRLHPDVHIVIPVAGTVSTELVKQYFNHTSVSYTLIQGRSIETVAISDCVIVASGTASLECALLEKPMCIIYKSSLLTYLIASQVIKIRYLGLCNVLQNKMIVPELLQYDFNAKALSHVVEQLLTHSPFTDRMIKNLQRLKQSLSAQEADCDIVTLIQDELYYTST